MLPGGGMRAASFFPPEWLAQGVRPTGLPRPPLGLRAAAKSALPHDVPIQLANKIRGGAPVHLGESLEAPPDDAFPFHAGRLIAATAPPAQSPPHPSAQSWKVPEPESELEFAFTGGRGRAKQRKTGCGVDFRKKPLKSVNPRLSCEPLFPVAPNAGQRNRGLSSVGRAPQWH